MYDREEESHIFPYFSEGEGEAGGDFPYFSDPEDDRGTGERESIDRGLEQPSSNHTVINNSEVSTASGVTNSFDGQIGRRQSIARLNDQSDEGEELEMFHDGNEFGDTRFSGEEHRIRHYQDVLQRDQSVRTFVTGRAGEFPVSSNMGQCPEEHHELSTSRTSGGGRNPDWLGDNAAYRLCGATSTYQFHSDHGHSVGDQVRRRQGGSLHRTLLHSHLVRNPTFPSLTQTADNGDRNIYVWPTGRTQSDEVRRTSEVYSASSRSTIGTTFRQEGRDSDPCNQWHARWRDTLLHQAQVHSNAPSIPRPRSFCPTPGPGDSSRRSHSLSLSAPWGSHKYTLKPTGWEAWDVHAKCVTRIEMDDIFKFLPDNECRKILKRYRIFNDPSVLRSQAAAIADYSEAGSTATLNRKDIVRLLRAGIIITIEMGDVLGLVKVFAVAEADKTRKRFIGHTEAINFIFALLDEERMTLPSPKEVIDQIHAGSWAICIDYAAFYYQFRLHALVTPFYCFEFEGKFYAYAVVPMGQRHAVALAQTTSLAIVARCQSTVCVFIDNTRFLGNDQSILLQDLRQVMHICDGLKVSVNDVHDTPKWNTLLQQSGVFLGIHFDYKHKRVSLGPKSVEKCKMALREIHTSDITVRRVTAVVSLLVWASLVLDIDMSTYYYVFKFIRRRASRPKNETAKIWPSILPCLSEWLRTAVLNTPRIVVLNAPSTVTVFTDASLEGWGCVILIDGRIYITGGRWPDVLKRNPAFNINVLEAVALRLGLNHFADLLHGRSVDIYLDNTSVIGSMARPTGSHSFFLNEEVVRVRSMARYNDITINSFAYVASEVNPADAPSRNQSDDLVFTALGNWRRLLGVGV